MPDAECMFFIVIALWGVAVGLLGALGLKFGAEDRPGFDERRPLD